MKSSFLKSGVKLATAALLVAAAAGAQAQELKIGFVAWRQRVRFHNALESIVAGEPIGSVAKRSGYRSASAFSAAFRTVMGQHPSALRE